MKRLNVRDYHKVIGPLSQVGINNLFARAVIEQHVTGSVYVDNLLYPSSFYILHPYGMSLLFGNPNNKDFNEVFLSYIKNKHCNRRKDEWMQADPANWDQALETLFSKHQLISHKQTKESDGAKVEVNQRVNFKFNKDKYLNFRKTIRPDMYTIRKSEKGIFSEMKGSVVPSKFWDNEADFLEKGIGFSLYIAEKLATTAFSAFLLDNKLELGMETLEEFRGKGCAQLACSALIDYCLAYDYEPIWACSLSNIASYKLAQKLGFEQALTIPYYRLKR